MMRDYAKNTTAKKPAARLKKVVDTDLDQNKTATKSSTSQSHKNKKQSSVTNHLKQLKETAKHIKIDNKKKPRKKTNHRKPFTSKLNNSDGNKPSFTVSNKTQSQLTSILVFLFLGLITLILVLLLFYVMNNKKSTDIKEITLPKPASFLNPPRLDPNEPAPVITIPINNPNDSSTGEATTLTKDPSTPPLKDSFPEQISSQPSIQNTIPTDDNEPKFTFYDTLTKQTVQVNTSSKEQQKYQYTYALQVASYKNENDANSMRARLLLLGLKPTVAQKGSYYVVSIGGIQSKREGDVVKHKLEANNIQGSMLVQTSKKLISQ